MLELEQANHPPAKHFATANPTAETVVPVTTAPQDNRENHSDLRS